MTTETQTTEQTLAKILTLCKNNGTTLDELLKLPVLDADGKIPAAVLRIVGALSAGAVIESGDNANGNYVRFADGTQVCWNINLTATIAAGQGGSHSILESIWTYPAAFINTDVIALAETNVTSYVYIPYGLVVEAVSARFLYYPVIGGAQSMSVVNFAIGRWKE